MPSAAVPKFRLVLGAACIACIALSLAAAEGRDDLAPLVYTADIQVTSENLQQYCKDWRGGCESNIVVCPEGKICDLTASAVWSEHSPSDAHPTPMRNDSAARRRKPIELRGDWDTVDCTVGKPGRQGLVAAVTNKQQACSRGLVLPPKIRRLFCRGYEACGRCDGARHGPPCYDTKSTAPGGHINADEIVVYGPYTGNFARVVTKRMVCGQMIEKEIPSNRAVKLTSMPCYRLSWGSKPSSVEIMTCRGQGACGGGHPYEMKPQGLAGFEVKEWRCEGLDSCGMEHKSRLGFPIMAIKTSPTLIFTCDKNPQLLPGEQEGYCASSASGKILSQTIAKKFVDWTSDTVKADYPNLVAVQVINKNPKPSSCRQFSDLWCIQQAGGWGQEVKDVHEWIKNRNRYMKNKRLNPTETKDPVEFVKKLLEACRNRKTVGIEDCRKPVKTVTYWNANLNNMNPYLPCGWGSKNTDAKNVYCLRGKKAATGMVYPWDRSQDLCKSSVGDCPGGNACRLPRAVKGTNSEEWDLKATKIWKVAFGYQSLSLLPFSNASTTAKILTGSSEGTVIADLADASLFMVPKESLPLCCATFLMPASLIPASGRPQMASATTQICGGKLGYMQFMDHSVAGQDGTVSTDKLSITVAGAITQHDSPNAKRIGTANANGWQQTQSPKGSELFAEVYEGVCALGGAVSGPLSGATVSVGTLPEGCEPAREFLIMATIQIDGKQIWPAVDQLPFLLRIAKSSRNLELVPGQLSKLSGSLSLSLDGVIIVTAKSRREFKEGGSSDRLGENSAVPSRSWFGRFGAGLLGEAKQDSSSDEQVFSAAVRPGMVISLQANDDKYCKSDGCSASAPVKLYVVDAGDGFVGLADSLHTCVPSTAKLQAVDAGQHRKIYLKSSGKYVTSHHATTHTAEKSEATIFTVRCLSQCGAQAPDTAKLVTVHRIKGNSSICIIPDPVTFSVGGDGTGSLIAHFNQDQRTHCNPMSSTRVFGNVVKNSKVVGTVVVEIEPGGTLRIWNNSAIPNGRLTVDLGSTVFFPSSIRKGNVAASCKSHCFPSVNTGASVKALKTVGYTCVKSCEPKDANDDACVCTMAKRITCLPGQAKNSTTALTADVVVVDEESRTCSQKKLLVSLTPGERCKVDCAQQLAIF